MKSSDLIRLIKKAGWIQVRQKGSHIIFVSPSGADSVSVPSHSSKEVATGTAKAILKKVGVK